MNDESNQIEKPISSNMLVADSNETAWRIAQLSPMRDNKKIWEEIKNELTFSPEHAENCWYSIPYKDKRTGKAVPVEGIGTRGAQAIARAWGHNASGGGIREEFPDRVICRGIFYDHMKNIQVYREIVVHKFQQGADGRPYRLIGKHWENAIQSGISKAKRNAQLDALPEFLKSRFFDLVKDLTNSPKSGKKDVSPQNEIKNAREYFKKKYKISGESFDKYISELDVEDEKAICQHLRGLRSALYNGETTVTIVFGDDTPDGEKAIKPPEEK